MESLLFALDVLLLAYCCWVIVRFNKKQDRTPADLGLFHYVETAEDAWARLAEHYGFDATPTETGAFAEDI